MADRPKTDLEPVWQVLDSVPDPEIPVVSVVELGMVRAVRGDLQAPIVEITPSYSGCPATRQIEQDVATALKQAGFDKASIKVVLSPAWTTDWINEAAKEKLRNFGIAPPRGKAAKRALFDEETPLPCPHCGAVDSEQISEFGSTPCKALWRCLSCREPFDYFKCL